MAPDGLTRDQRRALYAYQCVAEVRELSDYHGAVSGFGIGLLRDGLCAALAGVQRLGESKGGTLLRHLAGAGVAGLEGVTAQNLFQAVRTLEVDAYMLATRELLQVAQWLKRAAQAGEGEV